MVERSIIRSIIDALAWRSIIEALVERSIIRSVIDALAGRSIIDGRAVIPTAFEKFADALQTCDWIVF